MILALPKTAIVRDRRWLNFQHTRACLITGAYGHGDKETVDPAHIGALGKSIKRSDAETVPILHRFHKWGHDHGEIAMWREHLPGEVLKRGLIQIGVESLPGALFDWRNRIPDDVLLDALRAVGRADYEAWKKGTLRA